MVFIKRKIIQIAGSTCLVSLPQTWIKRFNINKGEEVDVEEQNDRVMISTERGYGIEKAELDISQLEPMILRCFVALYKRGVDEIRITFDNIDLIKDIQRAIGKEAVGYEIIDQGRNFCVIKHVSGELEDFEPILRRTFLLLLSMADESLQSIKKGDYAVLHNIAFLEEANNRFTTSCRRYLNRRGHKDVRKTGPMYYVVEDLENLADEYKYLCMYFYAKSGEKIVVEKEMLQLYEQTNKLLRLYYELFYKFDREKLTYIGKFRKDVVERALSCIEKSKNPADRVMAHHLLVISQKIFNLVGPYLVMNL